ncbi:MAG TPA: hypothetical protein PK513_02345 [Alphaproteobacteria bacterium]|nr:hypothetical protein [Alphaproteobacteria bacterium]USO05933.1 MAG: hypothetical protein H6859_01635 [Rhodospirillales bacterium]HOO81325.1 hypothetical protein [Alphaproteobacteria bacterium]
MNDPLPATEHIFNALRRSIMGEFEDLNITFIPYADGDIEAAFEAKKRELREHPAGTKLLYRIEKKLSTDPQNSFFAALADHKSSKALGILKKHSVIAACFINQHDLERFEDLNTACKFIGYSTAFEAIHAYLGLLHPPGNEKQQKKTPSSPASESLRTHLKGQAFAVMIMESSGEKGTLRTLLKALCEYSTTPSLYFEPEKNPLPLAADGINVVYKDLKDEIPPKTGPLEHTHYMAEEIGNTYDDISLRQWIRFCYGAQEMAWAGTSQNDILSAAVYGSDTPHIRSYAHICAEMLNMTPVPLKNNEIYNPFTEDSISERLHIRACKRAFAEVREAVEEQNNPALFLQKAREQTRALLKGRPLGWCAPALIEAENAYRLFKESRTAEEEIIDNAFEASFSQIKWRDIKKLNRKFIAYRRSDQILTATAALELIGKDETYAPYKNAFEILNNGS